MQIDVDRGVQGMNAGIGTTGQCEIIIVDGFKIQQTDFEGALDGGIHRVNIVEIAWFGALDASVIGRFCFNGFAYDTCCMPIWVLKIW